MALIELKNICKSYPLEGLNLKILKGINLQIESGEFVAIMGPSGSGKSTLMNILGCLDKPTSGHYQLDGKNVEKLSPDELAEIRNQKIGFVFQGFNLLSRTTALENVELPMVYAQVPAEERRERAVKALKQVGLDKRMYHQPNQLSGGQQQRLCIARVLAVQPDVLLMDEPCSAIDPTSVSKVEDLMAELAPEMTIIIVTHSMQQAARISDYTAFFLQEVAGEPATLIEYGQTDAIFTSPVDSRTEDYITGRFG